MFSVLSAHWSVFAGVVLEEEKVLDDARSHTVLLWTLKNRQFEDEGNLPSSQ